MHPVILNVQRIQNITRMRCTALTWDVKKEFKNLSEEEKKRSVNFAQLMEMVAQVNPKLRIRFSTSHPLDDDERETFESVDLLWQEFFNKVKYRY